MLVTKYNGHTFFVHNFGNYDIGFIIKVLTTKNTIYNIYNINAIILSRYSLIISLSIGIKYKGRSLSIKIVDNYNILSVSLRDLCKTVYIH